jgi:hypothetical protein
MKLNLVELSYVEEIINAFRDFDNILCFIVLLILKEIFASLFFQSKKRKGCFDAIINLFSYYNLRFILFNILFIYECKKLNNFRNGNKYISFNFLNIHKNIMIQYLTSLWSLTRLYIHHSLNNTSKIFNQLFIMMFIL